MPAGYSLAQAQWKNMPAEGDLHILVGVSAPGQNWSEQRALGITNFLDEQIAANPDRKITYEKIDSGTDLATDGDRVGAYLSAHPETNAYFDTGFWHAAVARVLTDRGVPPGKVLLGGFDLVPEVLDQMKAGYVQVQIDQQPYMQGFMPVMEVYLAKNVGLAPADIDTGQGIVTPDMVDRDHGALRQGRALTAPRPGARAPGAAFSAEGRPCDGSSSSPCRNRSWRRRCSWSCSSLLFQIRSGGVFLGYNNLRGILGFLPEMGLIAIGVTLADDRRRVRPLGRLGLRARADDHGGADDARLAVLAGLRHRPPRLRRDRLHQRLGDDPVRHPVLHHHPRHDVHGAVADRGGLRRLSAAARTSTRSPSTCSSPTSAPGRCSAPPSSGSPAIAVVMSLLLGRTNFGNWVRATGGFLPAAQAMGIPTKWVKITCFIICSLLAGFAGIIQVLRLGSPLPSLGIGYELQAVAAAVIGGTSLAGGIGSVIGGIIGATLIRVIDNGMVMSQINGNWFQFAVGALTIFAVVGNAWMRKRGRAMKVETDRK